MFKIFISSLFMYFVIAFNVKASEFESVEKLKTFFTSTVERSKLDEMRRTGRFNKRQQDADITVNSEPKKVKVRGLVMRENGEPVVWINEGSTLKSRVIDNDIKVNTQRIQSGEKIPLNINHHRINMKPGQEWTENDNKIQDSYQTK